MKIKLSLLGKEFLEHAIFTIFASFVVVLVFALLLAYIFGLLSIFICIYEYNTLFFVLTTTNDIVLLFYASCHYAALFTIFYLIFFICTKLKEFLKKCFIIERN